MKFKFLLENSFTLRCFTTLRCKVFLLATTTIAVTLALGLFHIAHLRHYEQHLSSYQTNSTPRFEASYQLENWTYTILTNVIKFNNASSIDEIRQIYREIVADIVDLESNSSERYLFSDKNSNLRLQRLVQGIKHSLNSSLNLKVAKLRAGDSFESNVLSVRPASVESKLFEDIEKLRSLALQNRNSTHEANRSDFETIVEKINADRQILYPILLVTLVFSGLIAWNLVRRLNTGLNEVAMVLRRERVNFSPSFFSYRDEFSTIATRILQYLSQEEQLMAARTAARENALKAEAYEGAIANLTHDLNTPATQVSGILDLIERIPGVAQNANEEIGMAQAASRRLITMIQDILDVTRSDMGASQTILNVFNPADLLDRLVVSFQFSAKLRNLKIHFENRLTTKTVIQDDKRLERIIANLIDNAIKYTNQGHITVIASNSTPKDGLTILEIEVQDTGIGIPNEQINDVFGKFERAKNHYAVDGLGIGLALVSRFVDLIGGSISVESEVNQGSCFKISIPCEVFDAPRGSEEKRRDSESEGVSEILLVEDDPLNMALAAAVLSPIATVTPAINGQEALEQFKRGKFDLVIMDWRMPVMDGLTATLKIREYESQLMLRKTPIWGLTANASPVEHSRAIEAGMEDLVSKPLSKAWAKKICGTTRSMKASSLTK